MAKKNTKLIVPILGIAVTAVALCAFAKDVIAGIKEAEFSEIEPVEDVKELSSMLENIGDTKSDEADEVPAPSSSNVYTGKDISNITDEGIILQEFNDNFFLIDIDSMSGDEAEGTKVSLIGVDVSDVGASAINQKVSVGDKLYFEYDKEKSDANGAVCSYLYFSDGTMLQEWLLENGYASVHSQFSGTKYSEHFKDIENKAEGID